MPRGSSVPSPDSCTSMRPPYLGMSPYERTRSRLTVLVAVETPNSMLTFSFLSPPSSSLSFSTESPPVYLYSAFTFQFFALTRSTTVNFCNVMPRYLFGMTFEFLHASTTSGSSAFTSDLA